MTKPKRTKAKKPAPAKPRDLRDINTLSDDEKKTALAFVMMSPATQSANSVRLFSSGMGEEADFSATKRMLSATIATVRDDGSEHLEDTLRAQTIVLDSVFNEMMRRAAMNMGEHLGATETYMRLGLKAQAQCRANVQALADIKNPRAVAFVKQANISNGPQQVNNGEATNSENSAKLSNKLLGGPSVERLDFGTTQAPVGAHTQLAAVEIIDGPKKR